MGIIYWFRLFPECLNDASYATAEELDEILKFIDLMQSDVT
jgi:hypothetical protein